MAEDPNVQRIKALARQAAKDRPELLAQDPWVGEGPHPDGERILIGRRCSLVLELAGCSDGSECCGPSMACGRSKL